MKVHELHARLTDAIAHGYKDCDAVVVVDDGKIKDISDTDWYDLGPGMFQIEID